MEMNSESIDQTNRLFQAMKDSIIVSCQVPENTPINTPEFISAQAQTVIQAGAAGIRAQGILNVKAVASVVNAPVIGLVKRFSTESPIHITPVIDDVIQLEKVGAKIVAIDATGRKRPGGLGLEEFISLIRENTSIKILADVDSFEAGIIAENLGCDAVATTLSGYTEKLAPDLPNIEILEKLSNRLSIPLIAEGGFSLPSQLIQAFNAGAWSICIGTAITNPYILTQNFIKSLG